jgi:hypothetical protein
MTYRAVITRVVNVRPHGDAQKINLATAAGEQVVIGKDVEEGTLGVFFPCGGALSKRMCEENNLYRKKDPETGKNVGGFFDENGRVRAQPFRGEKSDGFWTTLNSLEWTGSQLASLKEGHEFTELNGHKVCARYETPATRKARNAAAQGAPKKHTKGNFPHFKRHFDTDQLAKRIALIPMGAILWFTCKCHGTSARTSRTIRKLNMNGFRRFWNKYMSWTGLIFRETEWTYVTGTRKVVLDPKQAIDRGYYSGKTFRITIHNRFKKMGLHKGETIFYEIVGFCEKGSPIMTPHPIKDRKLRKQYGKNPFALGKMVYSYGCDPDDEDIDKRYRILVYRITTTNEDGAVTELPWTSVMSRCRELGLETVPVLQGPAVYNGQRERFMEFVDNLATGEDPIDPRHIKEGVCVRVEHDRKFDIYKHKSYNFKVLEGIARDSDDFIDLEEIS